MAPSTQLRIVDVCTSVSLLCHALVKQREAVLEEELASMEQKAYEEQELLRRRIQVLMDKVGLPAGLDWLMLSTDSECVRIGVGRAQSKEATPSKIEDGQH